MHFKKLLMLNLLERKKKGGNVIHILLPFLEAEQFESLLACEATSHYFCLPFK